MRKMCGTILAGAIALAPAIALDGDPQSLLERARTSLDNGDVRGAQAAIDDLRARLKGDPAWDPDGAFTERLLPALEHRVVNVRQAIEELRRLPGDARGAGEGRHDSADPDDISPYFEQARERIRAAADEVDRILATVQAGNDRCAVMLAEEIPRTVDVVEEDILPTLDRTIGEHMSRYSDDDERVRALKTRLDSLKREIVSDAVEREDLENRIAASEEYRRQVERVMIELIGVDPNAPPDTTASDLGILDVALSKRIREVWEALGALERQSPFESELCRETIARFRAANAANVAHGGRDLSDRIDVLDDRLAGVPVDGNPSATGDSTDDTLSACLR